MYIYMYICKYIFTCIYIYLYTQIYILKFSFPPSHYDYCLVIHYHYMHLTQLLPEMEMNTALRDDGNWCFANKFLKRLMIERTSQPMKLEGYR